MSQESSTIVRLAPGPNAANISFEQAFGEWSEARGKRAAKKAARQAAKTERKAVKQSAKLERKTNRVENRDAKKRVASETRQQRRSDKKQNRQDLRIGRRANRKEQRQDMRDEQQQRRLGRRDESKMRRIERKGFGYDDYEDQNLEDNYIDDQNYDDSGYDDYDDSYYEDYDDGYYDEGYEDYDYGYEDEPDYETDYEDYYDYQPEWEGDFANFDGEAKADDVFMTETDENVFVPKDVLETAVKIEWNKELIDQLQTKGKKLQNSGEDDTAVKQALVERVARLKDLCDAEGAFSAASGENTLVVRKAKRIARSKRADASPHYRTAKFNRTTRVQRGIGAQIEPNRIVIPGKEITSEFSGGKNIDWKPIALGVGIGLGAIVLLKVVKVIK